MQMESEGSFFNGNIKDFLVKCDRLRENRAQRGVHKYREKIDRFLKKCIVSSRRKGTVRSIIAGTT